jgi:hypothetical protein
MASDSEISLLDAVEFVTSDPGDRLVLYRSAHNTAGDRDPHHLATTASELALLERRAEAEGLPAG